MSAVWNKLFGNGSIAANDESPRGFNAVEQALAEFNSEPATRKVLLPAASPTGRGPALPKVAAFPPPSEDSFDAIGQRNESMRNQLDGIAESFRDIDSIRGKFEAVISPIARLLRDLEEARSSLEDSRQRHAALTIAHDELRRDHLAAANERDSLAEQRDALQSDNRQLQQTSRETESSLAEAQLAMIESSLKVGNVELALENAALNARGLEETNAALRTTLDTREKLLTESEQRRASVSHQCELAQEEARALRKQLDDQSHETAKMARLHAEVDVQRNEFARRALELEGQLANESGAHAKLRSTRQDENEAHRIQAASLSGELSAARARAETAERLLTEVRQELRDRLQEARVAERRALDLESSVQNQVKKQAELARELAAVKQRLGEVEASRTVLIERSSELAKAAKARDHAMQRADEKISMLESRLAESYKVAQTQRALLEAKLVERAEQAQSASAARAYAEGALQSARRERMNMQRELAASKGGRTGENETLDSAADAPTASETGPNRDGVLVRIAS